MKQKSQRQNEKFYLDQLKQNTSYNHNAHIFSSTQKALNIVIICKNVNKI